MTTTAEFSPKGEENKNYFASIQIPFPPVTENKINTKEFLSASSSVVKLIDKFGKVFAPVKNDMQGNIQKITKTYKTNPEKYAFLEDMLLAEKEQQRIIAIDALQWLRRALHFILKFLQLIIMDAEAGGIETSLAPYLKTAYGETLQMYHGWMGTHLFNILMRFAPTRKDFFAALKVEIDEKEENIIEGMRLFTTGLEVCVEHLMDFYNLHEIESNARV